MMIGTNRPSCGRRARRPGHQGPPPPPDPCRRSQAACCAALWSNNSVRGVVRLTHLLSYPSHLRDVVLLIGATITLRFVYRPPPKIGWVDAFYSNRRKNDDHDRVRRLQLREPAPPCCRACLHLLMFSGVTTTALFWSSFVADVFCRVRFCFRAHAPGGGSLLRNHIVVGRGSIGLGIRWSATCRSLLRRRGDRRNEDNLFLSPVRASSVRAGHLATLPWPDSAATGRVGSRPAVAVLTRDDITIFEPASCCPNAGQ